jgi:hypothetical protein
MISIGMKRKSGMNTGFSLGPNRFGHYDVFANAAQQDPNDITRVYRFEDLDFRLRLKSRAVDAGMILPKVNDNFAG